MVVLVMLFAVITVCIIPALKGRNNYVTPCGIPCKQKYTEQDFLRETVPKYSAKEYLERIKSEHTQILKERESQEPYVIILWWGFDGLRINKDNSLEWVKQTAQRKHECQRMQEYKSFNDLLALMNNARNLTPQSALQSMFFTYMETQSRRATLDQIMYSQTQNSINAFHRNNSSNIATQARWL